MSWFSKAIGIDAKRNRVNQDRSQIQGQIDYNNNPLNFNDALTKTAGAYLQNAMPQFQQSLQMTRENGIRRGISTGDLGMSTEGNLTSAFQRNIANAISGLAFQGYEGSQNRNMDLLSGKTALDENDLNSQYNMLGGLFKGLSTAAGSYYGAH